jgi:hypothetical protein
MKHHTIIIHYTENGQSNELVKSSASKDACEKKAKQLNKFYAPNGNSPDGDEYSIATVVDDNLKQKMKFTD